MAKLIEFSFQPLSAFTFMPESFTIFGAICWGIKILYGEDELLELLAEFRESPPFLVSSPLPKFEGRLLFPRPILKGGWEETEEDYLLKKKIKKLEYIDENSLIEVLKGKVRTEKELSAVLKEVSSSPYLEVGTLHAKINRKSWTTDEGSLYNESALYFSEGFSVFFLFFREDLIEKVYSSLRFVRLGGNKSVGMGEYVLSFQEYTGKLKEFVKGKGNFFFSLSPHFYDDSYLLEESYYDVFPYVSPVDNFYERITKNIWKKKLLYIAKGSVIKVKEKKPFYGSLKKVLEADDTAVFQYGFAFPLFMREEP